MHIVIVGCGRVGSGLALELVELGHSVAVIDRNPKAFRRLPDDWSGTVVVGSGFDRDDLDRAGAREAVSLAAVTSGDNSNILTARIARETYEIPNVVARIYDPRRAQIYLRLGIPTVATVSWTIDQVRRRLVPGEVESEWTDSTGKISLVERELPERWAGKRLADVSVPGESDVEWTDPTGSVCLVERALPARWAGKRLADLGIPGEVTLVSVTRAGGVRLDIDDLVGQDGDVLHLVVSDAARHRLDERFEPRPVDVGAGGSVAVAPARSADGTGAAS